MFDEFKTFVAISRWGTFTLAAEKVGLSPAAVSGHIKRLEENLGVELFERTGRSATLNAEGARLLPRIQSILGMVDGLLDDDTSGTLKIGAVASVQGSFLGPALSAFRAVYPNYGVHVVPGLSLQLIDQVDSGEMDLAVMIHPPFPLSTDLAWHSLKREPFVLIAPPDCPGATWQEVITTQPFIGYHRLSSGGRQVNRFLRTLRFKVDPVVEVPLQAMLSGVRNGLGVALVPQSAGSASPEVRILSLEGEDLHRDIGFIRSRIVEPSPAMLHLADCLMAVGTAHA